MKATCLVVRSAAPSANLSRLSSRLESHISACLGCQVEMARYGRLRRELASLVHEVEAAPVPLAAAVDLAIAAGDLPAEQAAPVLSPARAVAAGGAVLAAAAGAVAVAMWRHSKVTA